MNALPDTRYAAAGDWRQWNLVWRRRQDHEDAVLYTPGTPMTLMQLWQRAYFDDLWHLMKGRRRNAPCLELGAGRGTTSMYLASRGCDVTLVDLAPDGLALAARNFQRCGLPSPKLHRSDARHTGLPSSTYDCVYNIGLLEHFDDPVPVLREALRILKPAGLLFMVVVPKGSPWASLPMRLTLNPIVTGLRLTAALARRLATFARARSASGASGEGNVDPETTRTDHTADRYLRWMYGLGQREVRCLPYNPYFQIYRSPWLERRITVPLSRRHLSARQRRAEYPLLEVQGSRACCLLLMCHKTD